MLANHIDRSLPFDASSSSPSGRGATTPLAARSQQALSPVSPDAALSAKMAHVLEGSNLALERTMSAWRLIIVLETVGGRLTLTEPGCPQPSDGPAHAMFLIPPGREVVARAEGVRFLRFLHLQFDLDGLEAPNGSGETVWLPHQPRLGFFDGRVFALAQTMEQECAGGRAISERLGSSLLSALKSRPNPGRGTRASGGLTSRQVRRATDILKSNFADAASPADLAAALGLSRSHFSRAFKIATGLPPHSWLMSLRIERAREMMIDGDQTLADVALASGFSDQPHFTRVFTRLVGSPPGEWRRRLTALASRKPPLAIVHLGTTLGERPSFATA